MRLSATADARPSMMENADALARNALREIVMSLDPFLRTAIVYPFPRPRATRKLSGDVAIPRFRSQHGEKEGDEDQDKGQQAFPHENGPG